jgi:hypothetical protein
MTEAYWSSAYDVDPASLWAVIRRFDGLPDWHPDFRASQIVEGSSEFEVGAVRILTTNDGAEFRERLAGLDDATRTLTYEILNSPLPLVNYRSQMQVLPISDTASSLLIWRSSFDPTDGGLPSEAAKSVAEGAYAPALAALHKYLA